MELDRYSNSILLNTFIIKKKRCRVYFHRGTLIWETEKPPYTRWTLPLTDALAVNYENNDIFGGPTKEKDADMCSLPLPTSFVLHYAARNTNNRWGHHNVVMSHTDPRQVASWVKTIHNYLVNISYRPRKILIFINPIGGKRRGIKIWKKHVHPLMKIAGIETKIIITERNGHIIDVLLNHNLQNFEAIVCIGGDGTFSEVFNGLVLRKAKELHIDTNDPNVILPAPDIPVGVIPSGSTDTVAYSLHGTTDVQTAVLHIIFGDTVGLDLASVHGDHILHRLYASVLSYGYLGDVIKESEKFRWMGPQRYDYSGFKKILANKAYEGEIELLSDPCHPTASNKCVSNCNRCKQYGCDITDAKEPSTLMTIRGKFFMVNSANVSCACSKCPQGFSPHCHIGDGCVDVILVRHTTLINNIRMLLRLSSKEKNVYNLPFVEVYRARELTFRTIDQSDLINNDDANNTSSTVSVWNCDGEVLQQVNVKIRVHCQLLKVFTRRIQEPLKKTKWLCFPW